MSMSLFFFRNKQNICYCKHQQQPIRFSKFRTRFRLKPAGILEGIGRSWLQKLSYGLFPSIPPKNSKGVKSIFHRTNV